MLGNLLRAELMQLRYRRRVLGAFLLMLAGGLIFPVTFIEEALPPTETEQREAEQAYQLSVAEGCADCELQQYLPVQWSLDEVLTFSIQPFTMQVAMVALVIVVLYVGSDFSSGALSTQLTFTPQRTMLLAARTMVAGLLGAAVTLVALVSTITVTLVWYISGNGFESVGTAPMLLDTLIWGALLGALAGFAGSLLTFLCGGQTLSLALLGLTIVGLLVAYFMVPWLPPWLIHASPLIQANALLNDYVYYSAVEEQEINELVTRGEAVAYFAASLGIMWFVTAWVFARRDIKG